MRERRAGCGRESPPRLPGCARPSFRRTRPSGFTLLEILLVLALIGLIAVLTGAAVVRVVNADHPTPEDVFWQACRSAQKMASLGEREVTMRFDSKVKKLIWTDGQQTEDASFDPSGGDVSVQFLQAQKGGSLILIAGQVVETQEVPLVHFYPDGTCSAFRVQFRTRTSTWQIPIDPWTCAPMLEKKEKAS